MSFLELGKPVNPARVPDQIAQSRPKQKLGLSSFMWSCPCHYIHTLQSESSRWKK